MNKKFEITASLICGDPLNLEQAIREIIASDIDYIHFDVMDGVCVPRFGLYPEILTHLRTFTDMPVDVHMMVDCPELYIQSYAEAGANIYYVHVENNSNLHRTINLIKKAGMKPGVVLNIATPINILDYILQDIDYIMLMAINPGIVGQAVSEAIYDKIKDVKKQIEEKEIKIVIDGGVNLESSAKMIKAGADILVCGSSTIFRPKEGTLRELTSKYVCHVNSVLENN